MFPVVAAVFSKTSSLGIKVRGLEAFVVLCGGSHSDGITDGDGLSRAPRTPHQSKTGNNAILDKYTVQEKVVPLLKAIKTKEPAVMMAALAVFRQVGKIADSEFVAMDVLPILWSFSLGPLLNLEQFTKYMDLIKALSGKVEQEQMKKLRELSSTTNGFDATRQNNLMTMNATTDVFEDPNVGENDFERLVLGKASGQASNIQEIFKTPQHAQTLQPTSPSYNWSNPSQNSSMSNMLRSQQIPQSRAITPDQSLNSFMPLKPTQSNTAFGSSAGSGWGVTQPLQPTQSSNAASNPWNSPPLANNPLSNGWGNPSMVGSNSAANIVWSHPPPVGNQPTTGMANSGFTQSGMNQNTFSLPPPGGMVSKATEKTGLDKYESLI